MTKAQSKRAYWRRQVERFRASGLSKADFCRKNRIKPSHLQYWEGQFDSSETAESPFLPVEVVANDMSGCNGSYRTRILLPNSIVIETSADILNVVNMVRMLGGSTRHA